MKKTMIFLTGALTGALTCRLIMKEVMDKTIQEEVEAITEYYKNKAEEDAVYLEVDHPFSPILNTLKDSVSEIEDRVKKLGNISQKIHVEKFEKLSGEAEKSINDDFLHMRVHNPYANLARDLPDGEDLTKISSIVTDEEYDKLKQPIDNIDGPYIISDTEFSEEHQDHDKITLWYYMHDDVVVDDRGEIVDEVEYLLGDKALSEFSWTQNTVYIRNENTGADYEVVRMFEDFRKNALGINRSDEDG
ncbi:MAG TPA: hypothetical protein VFC70_03285 [Oscillospiraceae bacterium]|nr:hypothetical protein [Oscillospiraceae bacterium]